jgi:hypothetical protein
MDRRVTLKCIFGIWVIRMKGGWNQFRIVSTNEFSHSVTYIRKNMLILWPPCVCWKYLRYHHKFSTIILFYFFILGHCFRLFIYFIPKSEAEATVELRKIYLKLRPDFSGSCSVSCASVNVDGFTSPSRNNAINWSHWLEGFDVVSAEPSVHTGNSHPESLQHECLDAPL